jgi:dipeptidase E
MNFAVRLMLISTSTLYGESFFYYCKDAINDFLIGKNSVLFVPYAVKDRDEYTKTARTFFNSINKKLTSIHTAESPLRAIEQAEAIFIGGGNTFRLLNELYKNELIEPIRKKILNGTPYIGSSAGTNVAAPTIKTTNDMPIIQTQSLNALNLIPFQINPHFIDADPLSRTMDETREERIKEFHEENDLPVVGLREGSWLIIENGDISLQGKNGAKVFFKDKEATEFTAKRSKNLY